MTWYKQPAVWAIVISILAITLSQLPPISTWVPKTDLTAEIGDKIALPTNMGIPGYQFLIDLDNTGNRSLTLSNLKVDLLWPNGVVKQAPVGSYFSPSDANAQVFSLTTIRLRPGDHWSAFLVFYPSATPTEDEQISRLILQINNSIFSKRSVLPASKYTPEVIVAADPVLVAEAVDFFNRRFDLEKGVYKAALIGDENGHTLTIKQFGFSLYDYHIKTLRSQADDYKYGWGFGGSPASQNKQVWAVITKT